MRLQLIRSATLRLTYAGRQLLIDPDLAPRHSRPALRKKSPNPLAELPIPAQQVIDGIQLVLVSHMHTDHFDPEAQRLLPKSLPLICQPENAERIRKMEFKQVIPLNTSLEWEGITITRTPGQHGTGKELAEMGSTSGFVLQAEGEPGLYCAGDTIWFPGVMETIQRFKPQVIVTNSGGALWGPGTFIIMDAAQTVEVCRAAPDSKVIAVHLESFDHGTVTRADLRAHADREGIRPTQLIIPADGDTLDL